jgi:hypothetical protein
MTVSRFNSKAWLLFVTCVPKFGTSTHPVVSDCRSRHFPAKCLAALPRRRPAFRFVQRDLLVPSAAGFCFVEADDHAYQIEFHSLLSKSNERSNVSFTNQHVKGAQTCGSFVF